MKMLKDCGVIVTGAASGIGKGCALAFAAVGAQVVVADFDAVGADLVANEIMSAGGKAIAIECDVGREGAIDAVRDLTMREFGRIDIIMNNAGIILSGHPEDIPVTEWERVMNINFMSIVRSNATFLPTLLRQGHGHIINTASFAGLLTYAFDRLPYAASKAAILQMSEGLALYLRPKGIGVTVLCPGPVMTNIMRGSQAWTQGVEIRGPGPEFELMTAEQVSVLVVRAVQDNVFFLPTHPQLRDHLMQRAQDVDAYLQGRIDRPHIMHVRN